MKIKFAQISIDNSSGRVSAKRNLAEPLGWYAKRSDLVELIYALYCYGCFGDTKIKDVFNGFDKLLGGKTNDYYNAFLRIRVRKFDRCAFLASLQNAFEKTMDNLDAK